MLRRSTAASLLCFLGRFLPKLGGAAMHRHFFSTRKSRGNALLYRQQRDVSSPPARAGPLRALTADRETAHKPLRRKIKLF
jgi:hypothetical protein